MTHTVKHVPTEWVPRMWPTVAKHLAPAIQFSKGDYTLDHIQSYLSSGQWLLLVVVDDGTQQIDGALTVSLYNRGAERVAFVTALGGRFISGTGELAELKTVLAGFGATIIEAATRPSVARLMSRLGFLPKYQIIGVRL